MRRVDGETTTFTQTYLYDSLNPLTEAEEVYASNQQTWKQNLGYDLVFDAKLRYAKELVEQKYREELGKLHV